MADWDKKYFVTELKEHVGGGPWAPKFSDKEAMRLMSLDSDVIDGAFYMETAWFWPGQWPATKGDEGTIKEHAHDFDEAIVYVGTDPEDPHNLGAELEFWVDGRKNVLDKSFIAFIPAGIKHGPILFNRIDKPVFHFSTGMGARYR